MQFFLPGDIEQSWRIPEAELIIVSMTQLMFECCKCSKLLMTGRAGKIAIAGKAAIIK